MSNSTNEYYTITRTPNPNLTTNEKNNVNSLDSLWGLNTNRTLQGILRGIPSSETGNNTFVQAGTGYRTLLTFPSLTNLISSALGSVKLLSATLYVPLVIGDNVINGQKNEYMPYMKKLVLYPGNDYVQYAQNLSFITSFSSVGTLLPFVNNDNLNQAVPSYYSFDVTAYINSLLQTSIQGTPSLLISPATDQINGTPDYFADQASQNFDRLIIQNGSINRDFNCRLKLIYWFYKTEY
jgi:hypothetical protein